MKELYITVTGTNYYYGTTFLEPGMQITLVKEPDNEADREAIQAQMPGLGCVGYVANSPHTVLGESISAGRLYDKIGDSALATVRYVLPKGVICAVAQESICSWEGMEQDKTFMVWG